MNLKARPGSGSSCCAPCQATGKATSSRGAAMVRPRDPGGADDAPGHLGQDGRDGCEVCSRGLHKEAPARARAAAQNPDLRSGQRDGRASAPGRAARDPGVLCRSLQSVAMWYQREHQWAAAPVSAQGYRLVWLHAARAECHRPSPEHAPKKMSQLRHAHGSLCAPAPSFTRCTCNLKPPFFS